MVHPSLEYNARHPIYCPSTPCEQALANRVVSVRTGNHLNIEQTQDNRHPPSHHPHLPSALPTAPWLHMLTRMHSSRMHACPQFQACAHAMHAPLPHMPPVDRILDTRLWKYHLAATSLRVVTSANLPRHQFWIVEYKTDSKHCPWPLRLKSRAVLHFLWISLKDRREYKQDLNPPPGPQTVTNLIFPRLGGGSRIFLRGCANSQIGIILQFFLPKSAWKWKNLDPRWGASLAPPP